MIPTKPLPFSSHTLPLDFCKHFLRVQSHLFFCRQQPFRYSVFAFKFSQYLRSSLCRIKFKEISPGAGRRRRRTEDGRQRTFHRAIRQSSAAPGRSARDKVTVHHTAFYEPQRRKERQGSQRLYPLETTLCVSLSPSSIPQDRLRVFVVNDYEVKASHRDRRGHRGFAKNKKKLTEKIRLQGCQR